MNPSFDLPSLFYLPLTVQLGVLILLSLLYRKRGVRKHRLPPANIFRCTRCRHLYMDSRRVPLSKCPKCSSLNEVIRR